MANVIGLCKNSSTEDSIKASNGLTDVLIDVLLLSGSALAESDDEKEFVVWLAERDQNVRGIGNVDFSIDEMPWTKSNFQSEKCFMIQIIESAEKRLEWDKLGYTPNEELIIYFLDRFKRLVMLMTEDKIREDERDRWFKGAEAEDPLKCGFPRCRKCNSLLSCFGCKICGQYKQGYNLYT